MLSPCECVALTSPGSSASLHDDAWNVKESFSLAAVTPSEESGCKVGGGCAGTRGTASDGKWEWLKQVDLLG